MSLTLHMPRCRVKSTFAPVCWSTYTPQGSPVRAQTLKIYDRALKAARAAERRNAEACLAARPFVFQTKDDVPWRHR